MIKVYDFFDELKLRTDSHIADFGCGVGENAKMLSELVPNGKVFAIDVHKDLLEHLETDILKEKKNQEKRNVEGKGDLDVEVKLQNIVPVWGDIENMDGSRLRDDSIDAILISNTFFLLIHKKTCMLEMKRVLKKKGKILFVDWHKGVGKAAHQKEQMLHEKDIENLFTEVDMKVFPLVHKDDNHFVLIIEK